MNPETVQGLGVLASLSWGPEALLHFKFEKKLKATKVLLERIQKLEPCLQGPLCVTLQHCF